MFACYNFYNNDMSFQPNQMSLSLGTRFFLLSETCCKSVAGSSLFLRTCSTVSPSSIQEKISSAPKKLRHFDKPEIFLLDDVKVKTDDTWNVPPSITRLFERSLLEEPGNPLKLLKQRIINYFYTFHRKPNSGSPLFVVCDREPRLVTTFDNFDSLNTPMDHVSRKPSDTYYVSKDYCLRSHTTAHQFRLLRQGVDNFIMYGDVFRRDEIDRTHYPCFHQMDCVRTYSSVELFGSQQFEKDEPQMFQDNPFKKLRTSEKQEHHSLDTARVLIIHLKSSLEGLCRAIFGPDVQTRWVDAYFPFTHPSFELEVFFENRWLEVLGCGVMEQKLLESAGAGSKVGWAFGLGLERLAMALYHIPDIRLFWSKDTGFTQQFANLTPDDPYKYQPISNYHQLLMDLSFWVPQGIASEDIKANAMDVIRSMGENMIEQVYIIDEFVNKKTNRLSHCYRIVYRSMDKPLSKNEANIIHKSIEKTLTEKFGVEIR